MTTKNLETLQTFTIDNLPDLDVAVLGALELFMVKELPKVASSTYKRPLVVGSGNAEATGKIIFRNVDALFASESTYEDILKNIPEIDGVILISASGEKHAPIIAKRTKEMDKHVTLITSMVHSSAHSELDGEHTYDEYVFPKNKEPYTYNTSTYMAMILGSSGENPKDIHDFITNVVDKVPLPNFNDFNSYYLIVPAKFNGIIRMLQVKFIELFGRTVARDVETAEYVAHATTVVPGDELFISFGTETENNTTWGRETRRLHIPLPENADYAMMMAVSYYVIGKIQKARPPLFKDNIVKYMKEASKAFGHELKVIVE